MKGLDLDNSGALDIVQFARWYFTGMRSYKNEKESLLKVENKTNSLFNALLTKNALKSQVGELKTLTNSVKIEFISPERIQKD